FVLAGQYYRVTLQLPDAEQLRAQQLSIPAAAWCIPCVCRGFELFDDYEILLARKGGGTA
ncbi:hypothetical protein VU02_02735, partial [Desulfobulbus sp. N2]|nr:hypothetical protein [Desulfobulbus sp. N2]